MILGHHSKINVAGTRTGIPSAGHQPLRNHQGLSSTHPTTGKLVMFEPGAPREHWGNCFRLHIPGTKHLPLVDLWIIFPSESISTWLNKGAPSSQLTSLPWSEPTRSRAGTASLLSIRPASGVREIGHDWVARPFQLPRTIIDTLSAVRSIDRQPQ